MTEHSAEKDVLLIGEGESVTAFAVRQILHDAWVDGHDSGCVVSQHPCWHHPNPHAFPPAKP